MKLMLKKLGVIFVILSAFLIAGEVYAGVGVSPTITEITVPANRVTKGVFTVVNSENETLRVTVEPEDWLKLRTGVSGIPLEKWLTIKPMEFDIEPQGVKKVEYAISPPRGYEGELIAMIFFASAVPTEGAFEITSRFGVSIYASVEGTITLACNLDNIKVNKTDKGVIFSFDLENQGNTHIRPTGDIVITGEDGRKYVTNIERGFPVYPGSKLNYAVKWKNENPSPGRYDAHITLDYGKIYNEDKKLEKEVSFTVAEDGSVY
ncbi:MAG: hypothetical protein Q8N91_04705 [Candidatus Omnitrophota bacterium]|nr:hypothetical protein [Candidatus Omnitrophota bacterium]